MSRTICRCLMINSKFIIQKKLNVLLAWPGMPKLCLSSVSTKEVNDLKIGAFKCKSSSFLVHLAETTSFWSFWLKNMFRKSPACHCYHLLRGDCYWEEWWPPNLRGNTSYVTIHVQYFMPQHYMANLLIPFFLLAHIESHLQSHPPCFCTSTASHCTIPRLKYFMAVSHEKRKTNSDFPWNTGCFIGILVMANHNPYITG